MSSVSSRSDKKVVVLCPHFAPDTAPTGDVMTRIVQEMVGLGVEVHVVTALPWYRHHAIEKGWTGRLVRRERTPWGSITRVHPFPSKNKRNLLARAVAFLAFSVLAGVCALFVGGWRRRVSAIIAMSPPLTLGLTGWFAGIIRRASLVFNIQDVFPDAAVQTGAITNRRVIAAASWLERLSYRRSAAVVVLSEDLRRNVAAKLSTSHQERVHVIPNFVDSEAIAPGNRMTDYRRELSIGDETVVLYSGNVGYSQSLELLIDAARHFPDVTFLVNGDGSARDSLLVATEGLANVRFGEYQPKERLSEVLATGDIHVVPLRRGLGSVSVPSKTYSILAAGRPVLAAIDADTEVTRILSASGAGLSVSPDDSEQFREGLRTLLEDRQGCEVMGAAGRKWVETHVSPQAVGRAYVDLISSVGK
ncbi:MAG: glycosyltransferase family 4 protein [Actinobacteria bacterium]|nr:glycosyltransferase family 4 protein [Actinomycetota bacterium]